MIANIHHAKTHLSKLIERAEAGKDVIIARAGKPVRLTPVDGASTHSAMRDGDEFPSWVGSLRGQIWIAPDMDAVEAGMAREMEVGAASS